MQFNSLIYLVFLLFTWVLFQAANQPKSLKARNIILLGLSLLFYGWWDWRFLFLIIGSATLDYLVAGKLDKWKNPLQRKLLLYTSIIGNLGLLFVFKYYDFFISSFYEAFLSGPAGSEILINIAVPAGISFYTFQTMSYTIDVYRHELRSEKNFIDFFLFVSYFPQLVAGPIERAGHLLPQLKRVQILSKNQLESGVNLILFGLAKKVLLADQLAPHVDRIFNLENTLPGNEYLIGSVLFSFQIYCDFSGYTDIARGTSRLFGIELMENFRFPYFSVSPAEFWKRWHISLYKWFTSYVYIPLGGNRQGKTIQLRNVFLVFLLSGLWHGANWTFIIWGLYNALIVLLFPFSGQGLIKLFQGVLSYILILFGWILFRSDSLPEAGQFIERVAINHWSASIWMNYSASLFSIFLLLFTELVLFKRENWLRLFSEYSWIKWTLRSSMILLFYLFTRPDEGFIYFQF